VNFIEEVYASVDCIRVLEDIKAGEVILKWILDEGN
jgi:hypothetical protein